MFIKKMATVVLTMLVVGALVTLVGCSNSSATTESTGATTNSNTNSGETISSNNASENTSSAPVSFTPGSKICVRTSGNEIYLNMPTSSFIDSLGEPDAYFESESCAFQGLDKVYTFKDFVLRTYPLNDVDYVSSIEFKNDSITTDNGCYIGMDADTIKGMNATLTLDSEADTAIVYVDGDTKLSFIMTDGECSAITYTRVG